MAARRAIMALAVSSPLILLTLLWDHPAAAWAFALVSVPFPVLLMAVGAARGGRLGRLAGPLLLLALLLEGGAVALLALPAGGPTLAGFPPGTLLMLLVLVPAALVLVAGAYAATFDRFAPAPEDLERLCRLAERPLAEPPDAR